MQRYSKKREAIYACLRGTALHPSADWIYHRLLPEFPDLSLATVYRNLKELKEAGKITSVGVVEGQERFDWDLRPHCHGICVRCGAVQDLSQVPLPGDLLYEAGARSGWSFSGAELRLGGLCPDCLASKQ